MRNSQRYTRRFYSNRIVKWWRSIPPDTLFLWFCCIMLGMMLGFHTSRAMADENTIGEGILPFCVMAERAPDELTPIAFYKGGYCAGVIAASATALQFSGQACMPEDTTVFDLVGVMTDAYMAEPRLLQGEFVTVVTAVLAGRYPCSTTDAYGQPILPHNLMGDVE